MTRRTVVVIALAAAAIAVVAGAAVSRLYVYRPMTPDAEAASSAEASEKALVEARRALEALTPRAVHLVVDTAANRLRVMKGRDVLYEALCSTGSGGVLEDPATGRNWVFRTPQGIFTVVRKAADPVWTKPDWAFVEEGKPLPSKWSERRDYDTLGDYALYFGDGFMIHGTLYERYLGRSITHGCVRLGDEDLKKVYELTPLGAPIYIF